MSTQATPVIHYYRKARMLQSENRRLRAEIALLRAALEKTNRPLTLEEIVAKQKDLVFDDHDYYEYTDGTTSLDKETGNDTD